MGREKRNGDHPNGENEYPEEQRSLMCAPDGRDPVMKGKLGIRCGRDVEHRKVFRCKGISQTTKGQQDQEKLPARGGLRDRHEGRVADRSTIYGDGYLHPRHAEREYQSIMTDFWNHLGS